MKDVTDGKTPNTRDVLNHVMDSVAMLGNTNWKLNMKRRELIKPELNPPYTRLCKEDIAVSTKLFGDDLSKHLKDMSEAKKAGQQMQKPYSNSFHRGAVQQINQPPAFFGARPPINTVPEKAVSQQQQQHQQQKLVSSSYEEVGKHELFCHTCLEKYRGMVHTFRAGQLREHVSAWESLTSDSFILDAIKHYHIEFESEVPYQAQEPRYIYSSLSDKEVIDGEISKLLLKGVIEGTGHTGNGFVFNVFVRPKKDGTYRMILNLKSLNELVVYQHFKMDNILTALKLMRLKCFMASVDLKDAYYSVPIALKDRKFLKFEWKGDYYQYTCLPNGLACAPRLFTKILKPIYAHLHSVGHVSMGNIDDLFLVA